MHGCIDVVLVADRRNGVSRRLADAAARSMPGVPSVIIDAPNLCLLAISRNADVDVGAWATGRRRWLLHGSIAGQRSLWMFDRRSTLADLALKVADGTYNLFCWDPTEGQLLIAPDLFGFRPLYAGEQDGRCVIASSQRAVLATMVATPDPDPSEIAAAVVLGMSVRGGSLFGAVRRLPAESAFFVREGCLRSTSRRLLAEATRENIAPDEHLVEECDAVLEAAVRPWVADEPAPLVALSGGLDSRAALGYTQLVKPDLVTASWGLAGAGDARLALKLARLAGVPHTTVVVPDRLRQADELLIGARLTECLAANHLPFYREPWLAFLAEQQRPVIHGLTADILSGAGSHKFVVPIEQMDCDAHPLTEQVREWGASRVSDGLASVAVPMMRPLLSEELGDAFAALWSSTPGELAYQRRLRMYIGLHERCRTTSLAVRAISSVAPVVTPFYSQSTIEFFQRVPLHAHSGRALLRRTLAHRFPRLAAVLQDGTGRRAYVRPGVAGAVDRMRSHRYRWMLQPGDRPTSAATAFRPLLLRHLPVYAKALRRGPSPLGELFDLDRICDRWELGDLGGLTSTEATRLFTVDGFLRETCASALVRSAI